MFDSELSDIPNKLIRSTLKRTIENEIGSENVKINVKLASQAGVTNFIGIVYRVFFEKEDKIDNNQIASSLILKVAPQNAARRAQFYSNPCFLKEIYLYDELLPYFCAFEQSKGVIANGFTEYPKCYRTIDVEPDECLMLEDLRRRGFQTIDRHTEEMTVDHVRLYLKALAKYHAVSLAIKDQRPEKFQKFASNLNEIFFQRESESMREFLIESAKYMFSVVAADEDAHLLAKVKKLLERDLLDISVDCIEAESTEAATVISYGDAHQNNSMFRYDCNGNPTEICLIDWQTSRVASPITDIVYFVFACTTKELRDAHYESLLKLYHDHLSAHIRRLGSNPEKIFPYELMLEHLRKFAKFGFVVACLVLPVFTVDAGTVDLDDLAENYKDGNQFVPNPFCPDKCERFRTRLRDIIDDMVRLEYI